MSSSASFGSDVVGEAGGVPGDQSAVALGDQFQLGRSGSRSAAAHRQAGVQPALQAGHPDHVELVEVAGEDGQELGPLQQRGARVLGQRQHPGVEVEPGQLPVEEPVLGQRLAAARLVVGSAPGRPVGLGSTVGGVGRRPVSSTSSSSVVAAAGARGAGVGAVAATFLGAARVRRSRRGGGAVAGRVGGGAGWAVLARGAHPLIITRFR